jgi:hypothetical protein|tara:strand:+ start:2672 stop:2905 length:234 start_codon:yes stop_codon:yes gene_type:complete
MNKKGKKIVNDIAKTKAPKLVSNETYRKDFAGAGKGDAPRPIDKNKFDENYDAIFRKENKQDSCSTKCKCKDKKKNE